MLGSACPFAGDLCCVVWPGHGSFPKRQESSSSSLPRSRRRPAAPFGEKVSRPFGWRCPGASAPRFTTVRPAGCPAAALVASKSRRGEGTTRSSGGRSSTRKFSIACDAVLCEDHDQMQRRRTVNGLGGAGNQVVLYTTNKARNRVSNLLERRFQAADPSSMILFCPRQVCQSTGYSSNQRKSKPKISIKEI